MKVLIIESNEATIERDYKTTSIVHVRNSVVMAEYLNADLISVETEIPSVIDNKYDVIICMYASGYMMYNKYVEILIRNKEAKIFWLVNEYSVPDNILLRKFVQKCDIGFDMIANVQRHSYKQSHLNLMINDRPLNEWIENWYTVNLNCLIFDTSFIRKVKQDLFTNGKTDCVYYSTFRPDRTKDLLDYNGANYGISTSKKNIVKFKEAGVVARFGAKLSWTKGEETLYNYKYSLYFEDTHTHTNYNYMANRFYECLMLDVLLFFDHRCSLVIQKSGYVVDEFMIVKNGDDLTDKIYQIDQDDELYNRLLDTQRSNTEIALRDKAFVLEEIKSILMKDRVPVVRQPAEKREKKIRNIKPEEVDQQIDMFVAEGCNESEEVNLAEYENLDNDKDDAETD